MAFKDRISGMFRFGAKDKTGGKAKEAARSSEDAASAASQPGGDGDAIPATTEPAISEEREALLRELSHGFVHVGDTIHRLDENLAAGTRSLEAMTVAQERLPALLAEQQHLIKEVAETASASRRALEALSEHLERRDQAQQAIVERLEALGTGMADQREAHRQQLDLVMGFHRSSRLFFSLLVFGGFLLVLLLIGALLFVLLRPQLLGGGTAATAGPVPEPAAASPTAAEASSGEPTSSLEPVPTRDPELERLIREAARSNDPSVARRAREALGQ